MSDELSNRSVALPGTIERDQERLPTPQEALRSVLSTRPLALSILSEARYRVVLTRNSVDAAGRAIRSTRDAELGYEQARRARDPRGLRTAYFWPTAVLVGLLLAAGSAASLALCWRLRLPDRIILTTAAAVLGGAVSWSWSRRHARRVTLGLTLAAAAMCAALMAVHLLLAPSWSILVIAETRRSVLLWSRLSWRRNWRSIVARAGPAGARVRPANAPAGSGITLPP